MKYAISNWIYGEEPLEDNLARIRKFGYEYVELEGAPDKEKYQVDKVNRLVRDYGLKVSGIAGIFPWPSDSHDFANPDPKVRDRAVEYTKRCLDLAKHVGAIYVNVLASPLYKLEPLADPEDEWKWAVESVRKAGEYAEELGVLITVEPLNRYETYLVNNVDDGLRFISDVDCDSVKIMLDCFHMNIEEQNLGAAIRKAGKNLINIHIADSNRQSTGRGHTDFRSVIRALRDIDYQYCLTLEPLPPLHNPYLASNMKGSEAMHDMFAEECITYLKYLESVIG